LKVFSHRQEIKASYQRANQFVHDVTAAGYLFYYSNRTRGNKRI